MNQARTRGFADFVNTICKPDLYLCLALWMEESPLASTSVFDFESISVTSLDDSDENQVANEDAYCDVVQENGPLRKKLRRNSGIIEENDKSNEVIDILLHDESNSVSNHLGDSSTKRQVRAGYCEEYLANCTEINNVDDKNKSSKGYISRLNKIGVVMVDSRENIVALDCSRDSVHGVTSVLVDFSDRAKDCVIYASRKPCSVCTKLMVQAGISKVCYLPFEPEYPDEDDLEKDEKLFRMSEIGQSIHVPNIQKTVLSESEVKRSPYAPYKLPHAGFLITLLDRYWSEQWKSRIAKELKWTEYNECKQQVDHSIQMMLEWIARVTFADLPDTVNFYECKCDDQNPNNAGASSGCGRDIIASNEDTPIIPDPNNPRWQDLARHMSRMANILAQRSNDPKRGVGAVILQRNQIVSACWNGYPPRAGYGDFPRASHVDGPSLTKKYPFSIHAEQAAILARNTRDVSEDSSTLFVSKTPCDECVPLVLKAGIKNVVFPRDNRQRDPACLRYVLIQKSIALGKLKGFESRLSVATQKDSQAEGPVAMRTSLQLCFNGVAENLRLMPAT